VLTSILTKITQLIYVKITFFNKGKDRHVLLNCSLGIATKHTHICKLFGSVILFKKVIVTITCDFVEKKRS